MLLLSLNVCRYQNIQRTIATERTEDDAVVNNRVERVPTGGGSDSEAEPSQQSSGMGEAVGVMYVQCHSMVVFTSEKICISVGDWNFIVLDYKI